MVLCGELPPRHLLLPARVLELPGLHHGLGGILDLWLLPLDSDMALPDETGPIEAHELARRRRELAQGLRALAGGRDPLGRRREEARDPPQAIREHIAGNSRSDAGFFVFVCLILEQLS